MSGVFETGARIRFVSMENGDWFCVGKQGVEEIVIQTEDGVAWIQIRGKEGVPIATLNALFSVRINYESTE